MIEKLITTVTMPGKQGKLHTKFYYIASEETGISYGDTYITVELTHEHPFSSTYEELHASKAPLVFQQGKEFWTEEMLAHVRPISEEDYLEFQRKKQESLITE